MSSSCRTNAMGVHACRGIHALAAGVADDAATELTAALAIKREYDIADATTQPVIGADLVEALVRCGRTAEAAAEAAALARCRPPSRARLCARARRARTALVTDDGSGPLSAGVGAPCRNRRPLREGAHGARMGRRAQASGDSARVSADARGRPRRSSRQLGAVPWEEQATSGARPQRQGAAPRSTPAETSSPPRSSRLRASPPRAR